MMKPRIVQAQPGQLAPYIDLLEEVALWLESRGIRQWQTTGLRDLTTYFEESIRLGEVHLAFIDDALVGTLRLLPQDPVVWPEMSEHDATYLYNLVVRRSSAGQGLGRHLLKWAECETASTGRAYLRLDCMADSVFLRRYYERAGFGERGEVDAHYPDPVGSLRLRRFERHVACSRDAWLAEPGIRS